MTFKGILFDKDGTLIAADDVWVPFYRRLLMRMKNIEHDIADRVMALAGYDILTGSTTAGSVMAGGTTRQLVKLWWPDHSDEAHQSIVTEIDHTAKMEIKTSISPLTDLAALIDRFRSHGWRVGIATNDSWASTISQVQALGIEHLLDAVIANDVVASPKPSGDMIRKFQTITGLATSHIVMVGDNYHDIEEARRGGAGLAVAVLSGNGRREDLAHLADVTVNSVADLPAYFGFN